MSYRSACSNLRIICERKCEKSNGKKRREERKVETSKEEAEIDVMRKEASNEGENKAM